MTKINTQFPKFTANLIQALLCWLTVNFKYGDATMQVWWVIFQHVSAQIISDHNKMVKLLTFHTVIAKVSSIELLEKAFFQDNNTDLVYKEYLMGA